MTMHIKMLRDIADGAMIAATHAQELYCQAAAMAEGMKMMAESMKAVVDDCAQQIAERKAAGISEEAAFGEAFAGTQDGQQSGDHPGAHPNALSQSQNAPSGAFQASTPVTGAPKAESRPGASGVAKSNVCSPEHVSAEATSPETMAAGNDTSAEDEKLNYSTLRAFLASMSSPESKDQIKAILRKYGVERLSALDPSVYPLIKKEVAAL